MKWLPILLVLASCGSEPPPPQPKEFSGIAMTIPYSILIGHELNEAQLAHASHVITTTFQEVDALYNDWNPHSEVSRLNALPANCVVSLSPEMAAFLHRVAHAVRATEGLFDPTIRPLHQLWKSHLQQGTLPPSHAVTSAACAVGWHHLHIEGTLFWKDHPDTSLDLGGITKGYCVDLLTERLAALDLDNLFVTWGGEIRATGFHPAGRPWTVAIRSLTSDTPETFPLLNSAVATSGHYEQFWTVDGHTYTHICHPLTHEALEVTPQTPASVTIAAETCLMADALATAAFVESESET